MRAVAKRNNSIHGLHVNKWDHLDNILALSAHSDLDASILPDDVKAVLRSKGCNNASQAALWRMRDSLDPAHNAKYWNLVASRLPKVVEHIHRDMDLSEIPTGELLDALGVVESTQVEGELLDNEEDGTA